MDQTQKTLARQHQDYSSNVDTSRPFRSVKEAIAIFGDRLLFGSFTTYDNNTNPCKEIVTSAWKYPSPSPSPSPSPQRNPKKDYNVEQHELFGTLKKLEAELEETKTELKLLKERGSETEIALATLNAELHMNMSKLAEAEAAAAGKKAETAMRTVSSIDKEMKEEERTRELVIRTENSPTLAQILSINGESEKYYGGKIKERRMNYMNVNMKKKKPIVPLVTDLFFKKKGASNTALHNPHYASPNNYFN